MNDKPRPGSMREGDKKRDLIAKICLSVVTFAVFATCYLFNNDLNTWVEKQGFWPHLFGILSFLCASLGLFLFEKIWKGWATGGMYAAIWIFGNAFGILISGGFNFG